MDWLVKTMTSSLGKKLVMAFTGICFILFVLVHLFGNLTIFLGKESFLSYVEHLHTSYKYLIPFAEFILAVFGILHVIFGTILYVENIRARPVGYTMKKNAGGRTLGSITAPYTGLFLLIFVLFHLARFRFVEKISQNDYTILINTFGQPFYVIFYVVAMVALGLHVSHGAWSGLQTLGINHPKYNGLIQKGGLCLSILLGVGFGIIPIYIFSQLR
jgi:succinate dehydrogenase / fumarate reductase cytochrome b subunit